MTKASVAFDGTDDILNMANGYEAGVTGLSGVSIPKGATRQEESFWKQQSAKIAAEKNSQQQLRNQLIEQK